MAISRKLWYVLPGVFLAFWILTGWILFQTLGIPETEEFFTPLGGVYFVGLARWMTILIMGPLFLVDEAQLRNR